MELVPSKDEIQPFKRTTFEFAPVNGSHLKGKHHPGGCVHTYACLHLKSVVCVQYICAWYLVCACVCTYMCVYIWCVHVCR